MDHIRYSRVRQSAPLPGPQPRLRRRMVRDVGRYALLMACAILGATVLSVGLSSPTSTDPTHMECLISGCRAKNLSTIKFLLIGDTGGLPVYPYTTYAQGKTADTMSRVAHEKHVDFVVNVGDNIYFTGVDNEYSERFDTSFENIYTHDSLQIPWYMIGGNHDHFGNITGQVEYTKYSRKWIFPSLYYNLTFFSNGTEVDVIMIDTIELCGNTADIQNGGFFDMVWNMSHDPEGPDDVEKAEKQWSWIERQLSASTAEFLFVAGHFPVYSMSSHGPTQCLIERLHPMLKKYNVSAYFAGHDHTLQHLIVDGVQYIVSGAASRSDRSTKHMDDMPEGSVKFHYPSSWNPFSQLGFSNGAFVFTEVSNETAYFTFLNGKGETKYVTSIGARPVVVKKEVEVEEEDDIQKELNR